MIYVVRSRVNGNSNYNTSTKLFKDNKEELIHISKIYSFKDR